MIRALVTEGNRNVPQAEALAARCRSKMFMENSGNNGSAAGILVIDDEPVLRLTFQHILEDEGYRVWVASNGREGLEIFREKRPDLVITDMLMPELDGFGMIDVLRSESPTLPIIVISAMVDQDRMERPVEDGTFCALAKPVDQRLLSDVVRAMLMPAPDVVYDGAAELHGPGVDATAGPDGANQPDPPG